MAGGAYGVTSRFAVGPTTPTNRMIQIQSESLKKTQEFFDAQGVRGTRSEFLNRSPLIRNRVGGNVLMYPTVSDWAWWMERILGGTPSGTSYPMAEAIKTFDAAKTDEITTFLYSTCGVNRATISGAAGGPVSLSVDLIAKAETEGAFPALTLSETTKMFVFPQTGFEISGDNTEINAFTLTIDNVIDADRYHQSYDLSDVNAQNRVISFEATCPWKPADAFESIQPKMEFGPDGVGCGLTFTNGATSMSLFTSGFQFSKDTPVITGRTGEKMVVLRGKWMYNGAEALTCNIDSTP